MAFYKGSVDVVLNRQGLVTIRHNKDDEGEYSNENVDEMVNFME